MSRRQNSLGNKIPEPAEELALIDREIHELKVAFEQYFMGIERQAPIRRRDALRARLRSLQASGAFRMPALRFRLEQANSRFSSFDRMWTRSLSEMERGVYKRDLNRMRRRQAAQASSKPAASQPAAKKAGPPVSDSQAKAVYEAYVAARRQTGQTIDNVTLDRVSAMLNKQAPAIMEKHGCSGVDFRVVIREGRALLQALPQKG